MTKEWRPVVMGPQELHAGRDGLSRSPQITMTTGALVKRLDHIRSIAGDDEAAHGEQDALFRDVLRAIAEGDMGPRTARRLARTVLTVDDIEFSRWMA